MTDLLDRTASVIQFCLPRQYTFTLQPTAPLATSGTVLWHTSYITSMYFANAVSGDEFARAKLTKHQIQQYLSFLKKLDAIVNLLATMGTVKSQLPNYRIMVPEDGSVVIEFATPSVRLGFSFESDPAESGWYLASLPDSGGIAACGNLEGLDQDRLLSWLLAFMTIVA